MFNPDFYPTPPEVIDFMISDLKLNGSKVLEPSAGSGNILKHIKSLGAYALACEKDEKLAKITQSECDEFLCNDFLEVRSEQISHIDYIIMNPPFSSGDKHILHAWEIAPDGCVIKALCNWETIDNTYTNQRRKLKKIIDNSGLFSNLGSVFSKSERATDVEIGFITLYKPKTGSNDEFEGYFDMFEDIEDNHQTGLIRHNEIVEIVNRYVAAVKEFDAVMAAADKINSLSSPFSRRCDISFGAYSSRGNTYHKINRDVYKKQLQKAAWWSVFDKMNMDKYVTQGVMSKLNKFVETQEKVPFKLSNIYKMIDMIIQTYDQNMNEAIEKMFDNLTSHSDKNKYFVSHETWKTNQTYIIGKKFIQPYCIEYTYYGGMGWRYSYHSHLVDDLTKALCYLTGTNYDTIGGIEAFFRQLEDNEDHYRSDEKVRKHGNKYDHYCRDHFWEGRDKFMANWTREEWIEKEIQSEIKSKPDTKRFEFGKWYNWGFFRFKGFKKGTAHFEFKDEKVWVILNQRVAKVKGFTLPNKF